MRVWLALPIVLVAAVPALALTPPPCDSVTDPAMLPEPSAELQALLAAGWKLDPLVAPATAGPVPGGETDSLGCGGIRPGVALIISNTDGNAWLCTANWIYTDEVGALYVGTAGHCASKGHCVPDYAVSVTTGGVGRIGDVAFSTGDCGIGTDFALIRIYPQNYGYVNPSMCRWGGPVAIAEDENYGYAPVPVLHYGYGVTYGDTLATRPRVGAIHDLTVGSDSYEFVGTIAPGDSGSALQFYSGHVVGIITHGLIAPGANMGLGVGLGTRITHGIALADAATGHEFEVAFGDPVDLAGVV